MTSRRSVIHRLYRTSHHVWLRGDGVVHRYFQYRLGIYWVRLRILLVVSREIMGFPLSTGDFRILPVVCAREFGRECELDSPALSYVSAP